MEHRVLKIFVGSPGDLQEERTAIHTAVQRINKNVGRFLGWHIDLYGWEDTRPGFSRPQELINKDVDGCELFIGMLNVRWGYPTGKFSSGFEEEFTRAIERRRKTKHPEVWLYFKAVSKDQLADPGEQLKNVLNFRKEQQERRELLYKEFPNAISFSELIFDSLTSYLLQLEEERKVNLDGVQEAEPGKPLDIPSGKADAVRGGPLPAMLSDTLQKAVTQVPIEGVKALGSDERLRLFLAASAWFGSERAEILLHAHHQNMVYRLRRDWVVTELERLLLIRTFVADDSDTKPGWYWLDSDIYKDVTEMLWSFAIVDDNEEVQKGAAKILRGLDRLPSDLDLTKLALREGEIAPIALELIARSNDSAWIDTIEKLVSDSQYAHRDRAIAALAVLVSLSSPEDAIKILVEKAQSLPEEFSKLLQDKFSKIGIEELMRTVEHGSPEVRAFALKQLKKLGRIPVAYARRLLAIDNEPVREAAVEALFEHGEKISMPELEQYFPDRPAGILSGLGLRSRSGTKRFLANVLKQESDEVLQDRIDFFNSDSSFAYEELKTRKGPEALLEVRKEVDDLFEAFQKKSIEQYARKYGFPPGPDWTDLMGFLRARHIAAALRIILPYALPADANVARRALDEPLFEGHLRKDAVSILKAVGTSEDLPRLLQIAKDNVGDSARLAAEAVISISSSRLDCLLEIISSGKFEARRVAARALLEKPASELGDVGVRLISSEDDAVRLIGVTLIATKFKDSVLEILHTYYQRERYFYNVVAWLDRLTFAPEKLRHYYAERLMGIVFGS